MYLPGHFEEKRIAAMHALMRQHPLATVVMQTATGLAANHIPLLLTPAPAPFGSLHGHVPRANPLSDFANNDGDMLVIFHGINAYISPSWYASKQVDGKVVPTWNYSVVHARGKLRLIDDTTWLQTHLQALTNEHESGLPHPWQLSDAPQDFSEQLISHLLGLEIVISRLEGKTKASQNQSAANRTSIAGALREQGDENALAMADLVKPR